MDRLPYGRQWLDEDDVEAVRKVLNSDWLTTGPLVEEFEHAIAAAAGARYAVAVNSGTAALHSAYYAAGLTAGDSIVTSPLTFVATATAALHLGASVRFADIDPRTGNIDPAAVAAAIDDRTKLIVPVDYAGHPADYEAMHTITDSQALPIIADAAHSFGAAYHGRPVGTLADATTTSFHPVKLLTTAEGGAVITDNNDWARRASEFRNHGIVRETDRPQDSRASWYYEVQNLGFNYRIPDLLCALGLSQLQKVEGFLTRRRDIAARYTDAFASIPGVETPQVEKDVEPAWHLYVIRVDDADRRDPLFEYLRAHGLGVQLHYQPVYLHPYFQEHGYGAGLCPRAEAFAARAISIPLYPAMSDADVDRVVATVIDGSHKLF